MDEKALFQRLDRIIFLIEETAKQPSAVVRIMNLAATIAGILGIIAILDIVRNWLGG